MKHLIAETVLKNSACDGLDGFSVYERYNDSSSIFIESDDAWLADFRYREHAEKFVTLRIKEEFDNA